VPKPAARIRAQTFFSTVMMVQKQLIKFDPKEILILSTGRHKNNFNEI
jgi:hypothetical protein